MAPAKLKRHLITIDIELSKVIQELSSKDRQYFKRQIKCNKKQVSLFAKKFKLSDLGQEASYAVVEIIAIKMKSHNIAEAVSCMPRNNEDNVWGGCCIRGK